MSPRRTIRLALLLVVMLAFSVGCAAVPGPAKSLPAAEQILAESTASLRSLRSVKFELTVSGTIPGFPVRTVEGVARSTGWASGKIDLQQGLDHTVYRFTVRDGTLYLTGPRGRTSSRPVPTRYAPAQLLGPASGLAQLLRKATHPRTERAEKLHGTPTFRIAVKLDEKVLATFIPGVWADAIAKFWVGQREPHWLQRVWIQLPSRRPNAGVVTIQLRLSRHNAVSAARGQ